MKPLRTTLSSFAIMAAIFGAASAQDPAAQQGSPAGRTWGGHGMMGFGPMGPWMMDGGGSREATCGMMASHIEGRLAYIKAELKVTDAQEALWNAYAVAARDNARSMTDRCSAMMSKRDPRASLPERLDQNEQLMTAHLEAVRAMVKALKPLYASLDDSQKKTADQLFWGPGAM
jgi:LTXXQ motif family protein